MYEALLDKAHNNKIENTDFLKSLGKQKADEFYPLLLDTHKKVFAKIDCLSCANCCKSSPPIIILSDIKRISKHLNISPKQFKRQYILEDINGEMSFNIVPCRFLNDDNSCQIYDIRPEACRRFPHTDEKEFTKRAQLNLKNTLVCPAAAEIVEHLQQKINSI